MHEGDFLEHVTYVSGKRYGTLRSEVDRIAGDGKIPVLELETEGALNVKEDVAGAVTIFITAPIPELERRLRERASESEGEIGERIGLRAEAARAGGPVRLRRAQRPDRAGHAGAGGHRPARVGCGRYHEPAVINPRIDELLDNVDSRYALVIVAAKRARQINNYHHQLGEGTFDEFPPLVESRSKNYLTMALEETAEGKIKYTYKA